MAGRRPEERPSEVPGPPDRLGGLLVATGAFRSGQNMAQTTLALLGRSLSLSGAAIGALAATANVVATATMLFGAGRFTGARARRAVLFALVLLAASLAVFSTSTVPTLVVGSLLLGVSGGLALPSLATAIAHGSEDAVAAERPRTGSARALAIFGLVLSASLTLGPLLESGVLSWTNQRLGAAYLVFCPIALVGALAVGRGGPRPVRESQPPALREGFRALSGNRGWGLAMGAQVLYSAPFTVVVVFGGLVARGVYGLSGSTAEAAIALFFATSFCARGILALHPVTERRARVFGACALLTLAGLGVLVAGAGPVAFFGAFALLGVPHGLTYPVALALVAESVDREALSQANAAFAAVTSVVNTASPLALGAVLDGLGVRAMLLGALVPVLGCSALLVRLRRADASR